MFYHKYKLLTCDLMDREEFMIAPKKSVLVDMVYTGCHGRYNRDEKLDIEIVELPYNPSPVSI